MYFKQYIQALTRAMDFVTSLRNLSWFAWVAVLWVAQPKDDA